MISVPVVLLFVLYYFSKSFIIFYFVLNYFLAAVIYFKASKNYFPHMKFTEDEIKKFREKNPDSSCKKKQYFHEDFYSFSRIEYNSLSFAKIYYGVLNYFWLKALSGVLIVFLIWLSLKIYFRGKSIEVDYTNQDRQYMKKVAEILVGMLYKSLGVSVTEINKEEDENVLSAFRKYLGPNYDPKPYKDKFTTVISNHICWADIMYLLSKMSSSFVAKDSVKKIPLIGYISSAFKTLYINRTSPNSRKEIIQEIQNRQNDYVSGKSLMPICLYPEGTTSNGRSLISFKKGAFYTLTPIKMFVLKVDNREGYFPLAAGGMNILLHLALSLTFFKNNLQAIELPVFAPNHYLFENFKHLGKDQPEIYSEACRHVMSEISSIPLSPSTFETKLDYMSEIKRKPIKNT
jgi:1-acyl-sn-glycerol-3-phosphate acyltransferase